MRGKESFKMNLSVRDIVFLLVLMTASFNQSEAQEADKKAGVELFGEHQISTAKSEFKISFYNSAQNAVFVRSDSNFTNQKIYTAQLKNGKWESVNAISFTKAEYEDTDPYMLPDGKTLYFSSNRPFKGGSVKKDFDIWKSVLTGDNWSEPENIGWDVNSNDDELSPFYINGSLYFTSNRKNGRGGSDIYYSNVSNGTFIAAVLMDKGINSKADEYDPIISSDGRYLVFSGWRPKNTLGKSDLYIAEWKNFAWTSPVNLGPEINSEFEENSPYFTADSEYLYFASNRIPAGTVKGKKNVLNGQFNIYRIKIKDIIKQIKFE